MASKRSLKPGAFSPLETFGQSIANVAPTATPAMIIGQVFALSGNGTWLAYLVATLGMTLVALTINRFARDSASPGSIYSFTAAVMPRFWNVTTAWSLVIAYICTATALTGGFTSYANIFLHAVGWRAVPPALLIVVALGLAGLLAYRDVTMSARLMLALEGISIAVIFVIVGCTLVPHGLHLDPDQTSLRGVTSSNFRLGLVLAIFSFVGFESATALGAEARNPLKSIPRAVLLSAVCSGLFFTLCSYAEVLGFRGQTVPLDRSPAPLNPLAMQAGLPFLSLLIDVSAMVSFFSCALACITAAGRVLFQMGRTGDVHAAFGDAHHRNATPHLAVVFAAVGAAIPGVVLAMRGAPGFDINGWMGTLATFGFLIAYILVCVAAPLYLHARRRLTAGATVIAGAATAVMVIAFEGSLYPVPEAPYSWLPYIFAVLMIMGVASSLARRSRPAPDDVAEPFGAAAESDFA